jgi:hypothetical protein
VPPQLKKTTPNFHLIMSAEKDTDAFCRTTLSAMILNYPPPTVINFHSKFRSDLQRGRAMLQSIRHYLNNVKYVHDEDLVLIVDGENSWFQLPSDVVIKQYTTVLEDANARLLKQYGTDNEGHQKYNQTILFGAAKTCEGNDMACKFAPKSIMPVNLYSEEASVDIAHRPARYLNSKMLMGPARDLRLLYQVAISKLDLKTNHKQTIQSLFATMFAEQQARRNSSKKKKKKTVAASAKFTAFFPNKNPTPEFVEAASSGRRYEFSIGIDYAHTLFQPLSPCAENELLPIIHANSTSPLPPALELSNPPFWTPDLTKHNPSPASNKPAYIDALAFKPSLDALPKRTTPWSNVPLIRNMYTDSIPAILLTSTNPSHASHATSIQTANVSWSQLWFSPFSRALFRNYMRATQSAVGYHESSVGGDRKWDMRGGRGGIWVGDGNGVSSVWKEWGEGNAGVCGKWHL